MVDPNDYDASYEDEENEGIEDTGIVSCPRCAHMNLEFRGHCRRCGATLSASSGVMPFLELVEWSPTDGPEQRERTRPRIRFLLVMALAVLAPLLLAGLVIIAATSGVATAVIAFVPPLILIGVMGLALRQARQIPPEEEADENGSEHSGGAVWLCPECGESVRSYDDICPACGAIVAEDLPESRF